MVFSSLLTSLLSTLSFGILLYEICSSEEDDGRSVKTTVCTTVTCVRFLGRVGTVCNVRTAPHCCTYPQTEKR